MKKRFFAIISVSVLLLALTYHSFEVLPEKTYEKIQRDSIMASPQAKADGTAHKLHWEEAIRDLQETFDLSEEEVTDLESLIF